MKKKTKEKLKKIVFLAILILVALLYRETNFDFSKISEKLNFRVEEKEETVEVLQGDSLKVYFLDVGQADSILITSNGENMLIDAGNNEDGLKLVSYLHSIGITNFKYVVGTHAHADHIGGNKLIQDRTNCKIFAYGIEKSFTENPILEPSFLYGSYPFADLKNKFLLAKESTVTSIEDNLPEGLEYFPLKGHFFDMCRH